MEGVSPKSSIISNSSTCSPRFVCVELSCTDVLFFFPVARARADNDRWCTPPDLMVHPATVPPVARLSRKNQSSSSFPSSGMGKIPAFCCTNSRCCSASLPANVFSLSDTIVLFPGPDSGVNKRATDCGRSLGLRLCSNHKTSFSYSVLSRLNCPRLECGSCSLWLPLRVRQCTASRQDQCALTLVS